MKKLFAGILFLLCPVGAMAQLIEDPVKVCSYCEAWNEPQKPFRVYGNTSYVGTIGLAAILITATEGLILIDGGLAQSARLVDQNIRYTPGHTPGGTTWTWKSCEDERCLDVVYADSLSAFSAGDFRFSDTSRSPMAAGQITASAQLIRDLDCDVLLSPHPFLFRMSEKLLAMASEPGTNMFVEKAACEAYADYFDDWLARRLAVESQ